MKRSRHAHRTVRFQARGVILRHMLDAKDPAANVASAPDADLIPEELALGIRKLAHDLSNALEIIVQTSYLLSTAELKAPASEWLEMLDSGVAKALDINLALRKYIKAHTPK